MNRDPIRMKPHGKFWYDIPLCDSEIICIQQNTLQVNFMTDDPKYSPLHIYCIEVWSKSLSQFKLTEKIANHTKFL